MAVLKNRAKMSTSTTGTGTITLGSAEDGYQSFADAGVANGDVVRYVIEDGNNFEIGTGTYTATGTTLSRTVSESSNSDAAINLSGSATVFIGATAADIPALYAANESSPTAQPSATGANAVAIGDQAIASGNDSLAFGEHSDATATRSYAFGFGAVATTTGALALGTSRAFAGDAVAIGIDNNSTSYGASGANSIAMGYLAKATGQDSVAIGKETQASGGFSLSLGKDGSALAAGSVAISAAGTGYGTQASGVSSIALGDGAKTTQKGQISHASYRFSSRGDGQGSLFTLYADTTDATATVLTTDNGSAGGANQIVAASDTCITFDGTITAMQNGAQAYASWRIEGLLVNDGGTTTLANSATTVIQNLSSWGMALSADNTNNALAITCTGEAAHNIRWVANIRTTECTFA